LRRGGGNDLFPLSDSGGRTEESASIARADEEEGRRKKKKLKSRIEPEVDERPLEAVTVKKKKKVKPPRKSMDEIDAIFG
jgi:hypothetical protein